MVRLLYTHELKPHEKVVISHALLLLAEVLWTRTVTTPILVDTKTKTILDGHHRWWVGKRLGFRRIPAYCVDYLNDDSIGCEPRRKEIPINKEIIIATAQSGQIYPPKTTRHIYKLPASVTYPLGDLF